MKLSKNFSLHEFTISQTASRLNIYNVPRTEEIKALERLCINILQPLRDYLGKPIVITSGYRSYELNKRIGGSSTSQHSLGQAADFIVTGKSPFDLCRVIIDLNLPFDQLILEYHTGGESGWVHCSYSSRVRKEILTINSTGVYSGLRK